MSDYDDEPRWLTTREAADYLNVRVSQLKRWLWAGKIKVDKPSGVRGPCRFRPEDLAEFMESSRAR